MRQPGNTGNTKICSRYDNPGHLTVQAYQRKRGFCDLVHLIRRSFNTLKGVGRENDMDNNHMLALIEQKMFSDDRKVWARHLVSTKSEATFKYDCMDDQRNEISHESNCAIKKHLAKPEGKCW